MMRITRCRYVMWALLARLVELVKLPAVGKVRLLRLLPAAERVVDGHKLHLREFALVLLRHGRVGRTIEILRTDLLPLRRVQELEIRLRGLCLLYTSPSPRDHG